MARTSPAEGRSLRLFLALDLPEPARRRIARWRDSAIAGHEALRPVATEALHLTLIFLGRRPEEQAAEIWRSAASAAGELPAPRLAPTRLVPLPRRRPRLLALDLEDEAARAKAVHGALERALEEAGLHEPEGRDFWPHVTLARVRGRSRLGEVKADPPPPAAFGARELTLYRSDLHPSGARYVPLERLELRSPRR